MYAYICPDCGAYLDPGEQCDCKEKAVPGGTNTEGGMEEKPTININEIGGKVNAEMSFGQR